MNKKNIYYLITIFIIIIFIGLITFIQIKENFQQSNRQIILLGDSILQNKSYVSPRNSIEELIPYSICFATDNSHIIDVYKQTNKISDYENSVLILSIGGNDLIYHPDSIEQIKFKYKELVEWIENKFPNKRLYLLDIYYPPCILGRHDQIKQWNNFIYSLATEKELNVIKISKYLTQPEDFIQCIEPSDIGSKKIAKLILDNIH